MNINYISHKRNDENLYLLKCVHVIWLHEYVTKLFVYYHLSKYIHRYIDGYVNIYPEKVWYDKCQVLSLDCQIMGTVNFIFYAILYYLHLNI